ncbi:MAG: hypothetical protein HOW73_46125 [Polyangiaceae bacterium]|nr:hypothetical protein [Polyangiaceae bacterium]
MGDEAKARDDEKRTGQRAPARSRRWMSIALALSALCAIGAAAWYFVNEPKLQRPAPGVDIRYTAVGFRLRKPPIVSPTEEYVGPDGQLVYLTQEQFRAANAAAGLPIPGFDRRIAAALAIEDPDAQSTELASIVESVPSTRDADFTAFAVYTLLSGALAAPPETPARAETKRRVDELIGCRFVPTKKSMLAFPKCSSPATLVPAYVMAGVGAVPLLVVLGALVFGGRRSRRAAT